MGTWPETFSMTSTETPASFGVHGPGETHYPVRVELEDLFRRDLVVAPDEYLRAQLPEVLDQVVREGVVVVDDQDPHDRRGF